MLIEDGILKGYMQDRLNARLMGVAPTGNGRRESFAHAPMPRMTNTFMLGGNDDPAELIERVKDGIYAKSFGGGQVDITSGKFVFSCTEAYRIRDGKHRRADQGRDPDRRRPDRADPGQAASATTWRSTKASASAARAARRCPPGSASRPC